MKFYGSKEDVAEYVVDLLSISNVDWQSITITQREKYAGFCVSIATDTLSGDIALARAKFYSLTLIIT